MANIITWADDYLIGVDEVDQQHKYLFELINETLQCNGKTSLQLSLVKLYKYTREHFTAEEAIMKDIDYPNYKQHQEQHNSLITQLNEKSSDALQDPNKRAELDSFLVSWLIVHILGQDTPIGHFLRNDISE
jgi:hemerythrin